MTLTPRLVVNVAYCSWTERAPLNLLENRVRTCYSVVDRFFPACGLLDLTEGMYGGDPRLSVEEAQAHQHDYLLDQLGCGTGTRILDVGCGYGTLLKRARQRGLDGVGIRWVTTHRS